MHIQRLTLLVGLASLTVACDSGTVHGITGKDAATCQAESGNTCESGTKRCHNDSLEVCALGTSGCLEWTVEVDCVARGETCNASGATPACVPVETCKDKILNQDETDTDCGGTCPPCSAHAACQKDGDCVSKRCDSGSCAVCFPGSFSCLADTVRTCAADGQSWTNGKACGIAQACDPSSGTCGPIPLVGKPPGVNDVNVTGSYFKYARFTKDNGLKAYCYISDVNSYKDLLYVHAVDAPCPATYGGLRGHIDVYRVKLLDSDHDGKLDPNQHPNNPDDRGPMEERVLTYVKTLTSPIGNVHESEIYATEKTLYFPETNTKFVAYDLATGKASPFLDASILTGKYPGIRFSGYDAQDDIWYFGNETGRRVYSYHPKLKAWAAEFTYPDMAGDHMDGMEFVRDPKTGVGYVYVSDMTSDYIGQYTKDESGKWKQVNLFHYSDPDVESVEGIGFGALNHFWVGGWSKNAVYELGGGDLGKYVGID